ncbi:MAG: hypothetical protein CML24_06645 [Rhizobiales bacterium]|nr:hypothetical protein [Hyphomicrobiales bacterium]|tara:strand:- start:43 stop:963 length:921 start_codon:yes stop_codon:yes gene_type:complete
MPFRFRWAAPGVTIENAYAMNIVRYRTLIGASGPPYNVVNEEQPFRAGSYLKTITVDDTEVDLTMLIKGTNQRELWQTLATLPPLFNPTATDANGNFGGRLLVQTPASGLSKFLSCVCLSGFKINEDSLLPKSVEATLSFYANYPYWQSSIENDSRGNPFGRNPEWFPMFPIILGGGAENYVDIRVTNNGDVPAYPTITISGPCGNPQITNQTLNQKVSGSGNFSLTANGGLTLNNNTQSVTINMLNRTVIRNNGASEINKLRYSANFWALAPGENTIRFRINGPPAPTASTSISIKWRDTYSGIM